MTRPPPLPVPLLLRRREEKLHRSDLFIGGVHPTKGTRPSPQEERHGERRPFSRALAFTERGIGSNGPECRHL